MMAEEKEREVKNAAKDLVKSQRRAAREAKRKAKTMHKMGLTEEEEMSERIGTEERKLLLAQRKLESIRILDELVERVKDLGAILPISDQSGDDYEDQDGVEDQEQL